MTETLETLPFSNQPTERLQLFVKRIIDEINWRPVENIPVNKSLSSCQ